MVGTFDENDMYPKGAEGPIVVVNSISFLSLVVTTEGLTMTVNLSL